MPKSAKVRIELLKPDEGLRSDDGWHRMTLRWLIDEKTVGAEFGVVGYTIFPPGAQHMSHIHENAEEYVIVIKGRGITVSGENRYKMDPGDVLFIPRGETHTTWNTSETEPLELFFVYAGVPSLEKSGYKVVKE